MYLDEDLEALERVIRKLQRGEQIVSIAYGDHVVKYSEVNMKDLLSLRSRIKGRLTDNLKRQIIFATSKGI